MPAPAGYEIVAAPSEAKPPAGYDIVPPPPPSTVAKPAAEAPGFIQRTREGLNLPSASDLWHSLTGPATGIDQQLDNLGAGGRDMASRFHQANKDASAAMHSDAPLGTRLRSAAYGYVDATLRGPLAPVGGTAAANLGEDVAAGNKSGAAGDALGGVISALMLRGKGKPSATKAVNKLGYAAGGEVPAIEASLPEIQKTVGDKGVSTVGDLAKAVQETSTRLDQKFNAGLANMKGQFIPTEIADALEGRAKMQPPSADGQAIATELRNMAADYRKPWTDTQLNQERMLRNGMSKGFYNKAGSGQMAAMRSSAQTIADQTIADAAKDLLYGRMERAMPGQGFQSLKQQQSHLIDVMDQLDAQVDRLTTQQAKFKGAPLLEKPGLTVSASPHGFTPRVHLGSYVESLMGTGPMDKASAAVADALPNTKAATLKRRAAVLALPLTKLAQRPAVPPPPTSDDKTLTPSQQP